jgi:nitroreductase
MNLIDLSLQRESVRDYKSTPVEEEKLNMVLEAARLAPSACNKQPWKFYVCKSEQALDKIATCAERFTWLRGAPVVILCCVDHSQEWVRRADKKSHGNIDIAIAVEHICLAATEQGLGTCWICAFDAAKCKEIFELDENLEPAVIIPLGYPNYEGVRDKIRKDMSDIVEIL